MAVGYPEVRFALGSALVSTPEPEAPAPYVVVKIGGDTYRISAIGKTLAPRWMQPIAVPAGRYARQRRRSSRSWTLSTTACWASERRRPSDPDE